MEVERKGPDVLEQRVRELEEIIAQQATAHARELEIEASLERVRARSLAMHHTSELQEVIHTLHHELLKLNLSIVGGSFVVINKDVDTELRCWGSGGTANTSEEVHVPHFNMPFCTNLIKGIKNGPGFFTEEFTQEEKLAYFTELMKHEPWSKLSGKEKKEVLNSPGAYTRSVCVAKYTSLFIINQHGRKFTDEENSILKRFATVFEQSYTRFLDLQKAEAQAREAQIQLALERVRARTMAMQKSEELAETAALLFQQVKSLGIETYTSGFTVWEKNDTELVSWMGNADGSINPPFRMPAMEYAWHRIQLESWRKQEEFIIHDFSGKEMQQHYAYLRSFPLLNEAFKKSEASGVETPPRQVHNVFNFAHGNLLFITLKPVPEAFDIFKRFAKTFEQSYTRFLDLQRAEEQAREAQIEAALERVRSRSMAMHKSDELKEVIRLVLEQFILLNIKAEHAGFYIDYKAHDDMHIWLADPNIEPFYAVLPYFDTPTWNSFLEAKAKACLSGRQGITLHTDLLDFETKNKFYRTLFTFFEIPEEAKQFYLQCKGLAVSTVLLDSVGLYIENFDGTPYTEEENNILIRFGKVFQQTYTRFLDLQKAEAQAREGQINLAVERVRARALAMFKSEEILEVVYKMKEELYGLNIPHVSAATIHLKEKDGRCRIWDINSAEVADSSLHFPLDIRYWLEKTDPDFFMRRIWDNSSDYFIVVQDKEDLKRTIQWLRDVGLNSQADDTDAFIAATQLQKLYHPTVQLANGRMCIDSMEPPVAEIESILYKMAAAFNLAYTRFEDLQNAEAQAREAQIEAALERVRSRTMGMQKSAELNEVAFVLFEQIRMLGGRLWGTGFALCDVPEGMDEFWFANEMGVVPPVNIPNTEDEVHKAMLDGWKQNREYLLNEKGGDALAAHYEYLYSLPQGKAFFDPMLEAGFTFPTWQQWHAAYFSKGYLLIITTEPYAEADIFKRFAKVFDQTYTRFLDLKKAEVQAREALIELSLERIRAHVTAMRESSDLLDIVVVMRNEFVSLGHEAHYFWHMRWLTDKYEKAMTSGDGTRIGMVMTLPRHIHGDIPLVANWEKGDEPTLVFAMEVDTAVDYVDKMISYGDFELVDHNAPTLDDIRHIGGLTFVMARTTHGEIGYSLPGPVPDPPEAAVSTLERFAGVFDLAYKRFEDLKIAEMRHRESQVELALERVRASTMAMQKSSELAQAVKVLFDQFRELQPGDEIENINRGFILLNNEHARCFDLWLTEAGGDEISASYKVSWEEEITGRPLRKAWQEGKPVLTIDMTGEDLEKWLNYLLEIGLQFPLGLYGTRRVNTCAYLSRGFIGVTSSDILSVDGQNLLQRFAKVFEQTYTRFLDLQKAEAQAKDAIRRSSLDRVSGVIAGMRSPEDLDRITPLVWNELIALGVPFFRCGVFIIKEEERIVHVYLSTPEGKSLARLHLAFGSSTLTEDAVASWRMQQIFKTHWGREDFQNWVRDLMQQGQLQQAAQYTAGADTPEDLWLHFIPFAQGMLYVGSHASLEEEHLELVQSLADAFATAYARYEDFIRLEAANEQIERTLVELKATQTQLIQQEKLASLGQLTAGIAHEIKNPLNFVNNFSEVSCELIAEALGELEGLGDLPAALSAKELLADVRSNLIKVQEHGSRADGIVRSMLQHSRGGSGVATPVVLNDLLEEFATLSYHGMRAASNPILVDVAFHLDEAVGMVPLIAEDISRVVVNLCNNAFDAMREKLKAQQGPGKYVPSLTIRSQRKDAFVEIAFEDNGPGIAEDLRDKILQPFFTTKKGTEGTGLGLSITHDIIKAHRGVLNIESEVGRGTSFIIELPG